MRSSFVSLVAVCLAVTSSCGGGGNNDAGAQGGGSHSSGGGAAGGTAQGGGTGGDVGGGGGTGIGGGTGLGGGATTGGGAGGGGGPSLPMAMACAQISQADCARLLRCNLLDNANLSLCVARETASCDTTIEAVTAGIYAYDGVSAARCVTDYATYACATDSSRPDACGTVITPAGVPGGRCLGNTCATGYCAGNGANTCTSCVAYSNVGEGCTGSQFFGGVKCNPTSAYCPEGNGMLLTDGGPRLCLAYAASGTDCSKTAILQDPPCAACVRRPDAGILCGYQGIGEPCASATACGPFSYCKGLFSDCFITCNLSRLGVCEDRITLGHTCVNEQSDDGCVDGGTCLDGTCIIAPRYSRAIGQECDAVNQCVGTAYCKGLRSAPPDGGGRGGICAARLDAGTTCFDEPFNAGTSVDPCVVGARCPTGGGGMCTPLSHPGETCNFTLTCTADLDCFKHDGGFSDNGVCRAPAAPGDDCGANGFPISHGVSCNSETAPADYCQRDGGNLLSSGQCAAPHADGAPCASSDQCVSGRCFNPDAGGSGLACQPRCF
jgi:hypothetical protein